MSEVLKVLLAASIGGFGSFLTSWAAMSERVTVSDQRHAAIERRVSEVESGLRIHVQDDNLHKDRVREKASEVDTSLARIAEGMNYIRERLNELLQSRRR